MSLVADYSSDSDGVSSDSSFTKIETKKDEPKEKSSVLLTTKKDSGPLRIVLEAPKFSKDLDSDEERPSIKKGQAESHYQSITFSKLKFKGNGSSLFNVLPHPKAQEDNPKKKPGSTSSSTEVKPPSMTKFVPHTVKPKVTPTTNKRPLETMEPLFPIGNEIHDTYVNESLIPQTLLSSVQNPEKSETTSDDQFYYGYDYSTNGYVANQEEVNKTPPPETLASLPREAEKFFGGMRRRDQPINIQEIDLNHEMNTAEAIKARTIRASTLAPSSSIKLEYIPSTNQKRSHNIMYLAHQAQMRDSELQEQYSANKLSKRQSQAKYGF
ncbi:hypothetical protein DSO57_1008796 [Entomophthora muscae]|uniref:Uncharacterized protein n=1 Tax=Entomophthora muscae TaxID=34485 RepID=A0ACC2UU10_9FUNG|nr:hypothetical protein DSO57_1008796 [Entomophthora muscae]